MLEFARYPVVNWATHQLFGSRLHLSEGAREWPAPTSGSIALYLHIPFCESLCTYCSFHRQLMDEPLARRYFSALRQQIESVAAAGWSVHEVYVGGGTPTVLIDELTQTLDLIQHRFNSPTLSVETNPNHLRLAIIEPLSGMGVNRLSVGVQSFDDALLSRMNRRAAYGDSGAIVERLAWVNSRFPTVNADLIFNLPGQSERSLRRDISLIRQLRIKQVSWYPLMPNHSVEGLLEASLGRWQRKTEWRGFQMIRRGLDALYTPSSAWCYNLGQQSQSDEYFVNSPNYLGLGSGSFSFINRTLYASPFSIDAYLHQVARNAPAFVGHQTFTDLEWLHYQLMMQLFSLKLQTPQNLAHWQQHLWASEVTALKALRAVNAKTTGLTVTPRGQYLALVLMREFFVAVNRLREQLSPDPSAN